MFERGVSNLLEFEAALERALGNLPRSAEPAYLSASMLDLLERAQREADREKSDKVMVEQVVNALSQEIRGAAGEILSAFGVLPGSLRQHMAALRSLPQAARSVHFSSGSFTRPLSADPSEPVLLRVAEVRRLLTILERSQKSHPLLVGEAGCGQRRGRARAFAAHRSGRRANQLGLHQALGNRQRCFGQRRALAWRNRRAREEVAHGDRPVSGDFGAAQHRAVVRPRTERQRYR